MVLISGSLLKTPQFLRPHGHVVEIDFDNEAVRGDIDQIQRRSSFAED